MRVAFLSSFAHFALDEASPRVSGGAELQVALLSEELARRGHEVVVIGGDTGQPERQMLRGVVVRNGGKFQTGDAVDTVTALPRVVRAIMQEKPDVVAVLGWTAWLYVLLQLRGLLGFRLIFICGLDTELNGEFRRENPFRGRLFEKGVREANVRYAMSEHQTKLFQRLGLPCSFYRNLILPRREPQKALKDVDLLWVARCREIKRPLAFLELAEKLPQAACEMICPPEDQALWRGVEQRAASLANVRLLPGVPYHEIQSHYDRAKVLVNTSEFEGFPNSFIQAGQGGAAILSLRVDPDGLLDRFNAGFCAGDDPSTLHARARQLLEDQDLLASRQRGCERFVAEWHDNGRNVDLFLRGLE